MISEEVHEPKVTLEDAIVCLYGPPKIGKSKLASEAPGAYFAATETGTEFLKVRRTDIRNWDDFTRFVEELESNCPSFIKTVIVDTTDILFKYCLFGVAEREGFDHPADESHGKGWHLVGMEFSEWIVRLNNCDCGVMYICHEAERRYKDGVIDLTKLSPNMPKTGWSVIDAACDFIFHMGYEDKETKKGGKVSLKSRRCIRARPTQSIDAGDRTGCFPSRIWLPGKGEKMYPLLAEAFGDAFEEMQELIAEADEDS
jgi:hypothetical protein